MADPIDKKELMEELAAARGRMSGYVAALQRDLDLGARLKTGVAYNPLAWFAGAAVVGLLLSKIPPMRGKVVVKGPAIRNNQAQKAGHAAILLTILKFGFDVAKPAIILWAKRRFFSARARATPSPAKLESPHLTGGRS